MTNLYVQYTNSIHGGHICEGQENDEWPNYEPTINNISYNYGLVTKPSLGSLYKDWKIFNIKDPQIWDKIIQNKNAFLAIVVYSDGDTFSNSENNHEIIGVYDTYTAAENALSADNLVNCGYKPWENYFAMITTKIVVPLRIFAE